MSQSEVREITDAAGLGRYEQLNREAASGSVFSSASWAAHQKIDHRIIGVYKGLELVGGILLYEVGGCLPAVIPATPWQGPVCRTDDEGECAIVADRLAQYLLRRYTDVTLSLHPHWGDVRPFINLGMRQQVRYTYRGPAHKARDRYEKRLSLRQMDRQKFSRVITHHGSPKILDGGWGGWEIDEMSYEDSTVTTLRDWTTRYYWQANRGGTWHAELVDQMIGLAALDEFVFDMVGCNSPKRALFKRQFGGHLWPYYVVTTLDPRTIESFWPQPVEAAVA